MVGHYSMEDCLINFSLCPSGKKLIDHFPELSAFPEFVDVRNDNEIKIAIALADINSPFMKIKDLDMRVTALFEFLDIGLKTPNNKKFFKEVVDYKQKEVIAAACRYIQLQNNHDYASWWSLNMAFYELQRESTRTRGENEDRTKYVSSKVAISNEMDRISAKLKDYEAVLFRDIKMKQAAVEKELIKIYTYPEKYAEKFEGY